MAMDRGRAPLPQTGDLGHLDSRRLLPMSTIIACGRTWVLYLS